MVKISVIIPVYNEEKYLRECLDSIINQTLTDIEIICVNDGSSDDSLNILKEYCEKDNRIRIISQENKGLGASRNNGLDNATGEYIYFIDSDDYLKNTTLEELYNIATKDNLDLVIFKLVNFNPQTNEKDYTYSDMPFLTGLDDFSFTDITDDLLSIDVTVPTKLFKQELVNNIRFNEELIFEDNLFFIEYIFRARRIKFHDECLYWRRVHDTSIINSENRNYIDVIEIFNQITDKVREYGYYEMFREKLFMRKMDAIYYRYSLINPEYKEMFFAAIKNDFKLINANELDMSEIDAKSRTIFESGLKADSFKEFDLLIEIYDLKYKLNKLKTRNTELKQELKSNESSRFDKIVRWGRK